MVKAGNNATKILVKTFRGKLFKKAFERARRGKDISSFERQEKESVMILLLLQSGLKMNQSNIKSDMCLVRLFLYICGMARGYYWIPQTDETLNGRSYYVAKIVGDITFDTKRKRIVFQADRYFPVGSVFHFTHNCFNYIITCRLRKPGLWFEARREDSGPICPEDIERFESGRFIHRDGYMHYI